ncbi:MAG: PQQ-binding-like beta-propeller repeat protein [Planctomycetales bacterium]|nr:PQQ-binding-like beta-propeller repeat protein [Planctomycetales bacterium]
MYLRRFCLFCCLAGWFLVTLNALNAQGDNWPTWRGPTDNGFAADARYPIEFDKQHHQLWSAAMPAHAGSTPVVWGDRIFVTAVFPGPSDEVPGTNFARCLDMNGKELWTTKLGKERPGKHKKASGSNSSPVTDGKHVFVYFKSGEFACLDFDGQVVWQTNLQERFGEDTLWWDLGTSPVLTRDHVVVAVVQSGPSYLVAFDKATGEIGWKVDRMLDAPEEANQTYSTPVVIDRGAEQILVMLGADHVTAHRASNGQELWRHGGMNPEQNGYFRSIASAVYSDGIVVVPYARGKTLTALDMNGKVVWETDELGSDVPTPAARDGKVYLLTDRGQFICLDIKTGKQVWQTESPKSRQVFSASPIVTSQSAYLAREDGTVYVVDMQGEQHEIKATNELDEFTIATPVLVDGKVLVRTSEALHCFGSN